MSLYSTTSASPGVALQLLGGGTLNYSELLSEGLAEKDKLEQMLFTGAATGYGDGDPAMFFIG